MPESVGARGCKGNRLVAIRAILSAISPFLELGVTGALLVIMGADMSGAVIAAGESQAPQAGAALSDPSVIPEKLRPVPMYSSKPGLNIDVPANGIIYPLT